MIRTKYVDYTDKALKKDLAEYLKRVSRHLENENLQYRYNDLFELCYICLKLYHLYVEHNREIDENKIFDLENKDE